MSLLKALVKVEPKVKDLLLSEVGGSEQDRPIWPAHASDLTRGNPAYCPREVLLMRMLNVPRPPRRVENAMRVTWDDGNDKQARINNRYLRDHMIGGWRCLRCHHSHEWSMYPEHDETPCSTEFDHLWRYMEPKFTHPSGFTGSLDGVVVFSKILRRFIEVKIMAGEDFKKLKAPLAEHRVRTQLYLRMLAESPRNAVTKIDTSKAHVLYVMRSHGAKDEHGVITPFKEYVVERNDAAVERHIQMAYATNPVNPLVSMPEGVCATVMSPRAAACAVRAQCFSGKYPSVPW